MSYDNGAFNTPGQCDALERFAEIVGWDQSGSPVVAPDLAVCGQPAGHLGKHSAKWSGGIRYWGGEEIHG